MVFFVKNNLVGMKFGKVQDSKLVAGSGEHDNGLSLINFETFSLWFEVDCSTEH